KYYHTSMGWNCRMDGIQAAVLSIKLSHLDEANLLRRKHALEYNQAFEGINEVRTPFEARYARHVYHVYAIRVQERDKVRRFLQTLEQSEAVETTSLAGDDSFVEPKTSDKSLQMRILDPVHNPGWDVVVALHRDSGCFHTSAWARVLRQTYNHHPFYLQFSRGRRLAALIPLMEVSSQFTGRRGVFLPFSDA